MSRSEVDTRTKILQTAWDLMEKDPGKSLSMGQIAKATGISRQAVYLHFASRTELLIATTHYVDEVKGLNQRLELVQAAANGTEMLENFVDAWGNYIPEIYSVSKALMLTKASDEAAAAAWDEIMGCLKEVCAQVVKVLYDEGKLNKDWDTEKATDLFWTMVSLNTWEQLIHDCGWSRSQYNGEIKKALKSLLIST